MMVPVSTTGTPMARKEYKHYLILLYTFSTNSRYDIADFFLLLLTKNFNSSFCATMLVALMLEVAISLDWNRYSSGPSIF